METQLRTLPLVPHPDTPPTQIESILCSLSVDHPGQWVIDYIVGCPPDQLILPMSSTSDRTDGLWRTTCFEMFIRASGAPGYREFNFAPSGQWAAYRFDGYREGQHDFDVRAPAIFTADQDQFNASMARQLADLGLDQESIDAMLAVESDAVALPLPSQFALSAQFDDTTLTLQGPWDIALSAVIEEKDGTKSYWALHHPPGAPDFHHPDCFALTLEAPDLA